MPKVLDSIPNTIKVNLVVNACNPSTQEVETVRSRIQDQLHSELETSPGYLSLRDTNQTTMGKHNKGFSAFSEHL